MVSKTIEFSKPKFRTCLWKNCVNFSPTFTNLQSKLIALETQKFQNVKIQENQERLINDLKTNTMLTSQTSYSNSQPKMLNLIKKSAFLFEKYKKLVVKNLIGVDNYSLVETLFLKTQYNKVFKNQELLYKHLEQKISR